jgi:hypothetical protein
MSSLSKKVSRFKSDRAVREDISKTISSPPRVSRKPILGGIVEIVHTTESSLSDISCTPSTGFPSCVRPGVSFSSKQHPNSNPSQPNRPIAPIKAMKHHMDSTCETEEISEDFSSANLKRITNMSEEDVQR